jgi:predicted RNA-binding Zn ribbon-like protein
MMNEMTRVEGREKIETLRLVGGDPSLDFVNTVTGRLTAEPIDFLADFDAFMSWSTHAGVIDQAEREAVMVAAANGRSANAVHRRAMVLREALYEIFTARAQGEPLATAGLAVLNRELANAARAWQLVGDGRSACWHWPPDDPGLSLARIAAAAAELLTDERAPRLRRCSGADHGCAWLFLDTSRAGNRRWCSMEACGNRAKVRAHYHRAHPA